MGMGTESEENVRKVEERRGKKEMDSEGLRRCWKERQGEGAG